MEAILANLPNLSRLFLGGISLTFPNTSGTKNPCPRSLQYLSISHVDIFGRLSSVLNCFARVENLELVHVLAGRTRKPATEGEEKEDGVHDALVGPTMPPRCLGIRCLTLRLERQLYNHPIDEGMELASLTELNFLFSEEPAHCPIGVIINNINHVLRLAPGLKHLKLCLNAFAYSPVLKAPKLEEWKELDFASVTSLETLSITFTLHIGSDGDRAIWSDIVLKFAYGHDSGEVSRLNSLDWESLRRSLSRFSELKAVRFAIRLDDTMALRCEGTGGLFERMKREVIEWQLEDLHLQGKLQVELKVR
ncbi:hypothetical protein NLI96_g9063 [Meripilus lineatus]|uniref:Uncharacterized protein n=1 Tax=Meripilus lineatus TaxID=2056292 RepID=A0AAD5UW82_9APHY|nr:hypothetical protein NLI96_g9063 [Physisporinus lineatus]